MLYMALQQAASVWEEIKCRGKGGTNAWDENKEKNERELNSSWKHRMG